MSQWYENKNRREFKMIYVKVYWHLKITPVKKYYMLFNIISVFHRKIFIPLTKIMVYSITPFFYWIFGFGGKNKYW